jgi:hypothetical protein
VVMLPEIEKNYLMLKNIQRSLKQNGSALLVIPSMESVLFSSWRLINLYGREGVGSKEIPISEFNYYKGGIQHVLQGIFYIDGVATKHYSQPEIEVIFKNAKLEVTAIKKLEYGWDTEFSEPPAWMKGPFPWDWLVECRNIS